MIDSLGFRLSLEKVKKMEILESNVSNIFKRYGKTHASKVLASSQGIKNDGK